MSMNLGLSGPINESGVDVVKPLMKNEIGGCILGLTRRLIEPCGSGGGMVVNNCYLSCC